MLRYIVGDLQSARKQPKGCLKVAAFSCGYHDRRIVGAQLDAAGTWRRTA